MAKYTKTWIIGLPPHGLHLYRNTKNKYIKYTNSFRSTRRNRCFRFLRRSFGRLSFGEDIGNMVSMMLLQGTVCIVNSPGGLTLFVCVPCRCCRCRCLCKRLFQSYHQLFCMTIMPIRINAKAPQKQFRYGIGCD